MNQTVKLPKKKLKKRLVENTFYVLDRSHIVFCIDDSVYVFRSHQGHKKGKNIVDLFEEEYPALRYESVVTLSLKVITRLRKYIEQLPETM